MIAEIVVAIDAAALADEPTNCIVDYLMQVVDIESPIHLAEAARRVARSVGVHRVGHAIEAAIRRAAAEAERKGLLVMDGDFLWSRTEVRMVVRSRAFLPPGSRKIDLISDQELDWALCRVLATEGPVPAEVVAQRVMRTFGFERTSREADERVQSAVGRGVRAGAISDSGSSLALRGCHQTLEAVGASSTGTRRHLVTPPVPYEIAQLSLDLGSRFFHDLPTGYLAGALHRVVSVESPIHVDEAARRLANACGLERVGARIRASVFNANCQIHEDAGDKHHLLFGGPMRNLIAGLGGFTDGWAVGLGDGYTLKSATPPEFFDQLLDLIRRVHQ